MTALLLLLITTDLLMLKAGWLALWSSTTCPEVAPGAPVNMMRLLTINTACREQSDREHSALSHMQGWGCAAVFVLIPALLCKLLDSGRHPDAHCCGQFLIALHTFLAKLLLQANWGLMVCQPALKISQTH